MWRPTGRSLPVGAPGGGHVGITEPGRGFLAIIGDGEVKGRFPALDLARVVLS